jgi:hypothetical protein
VIHGTDILSGNDRETGQGKAALTPTAAEEQKGRKGSGYFQISRIVGLNKNKPQSHLVTDKFQQYNEMRRLIKRPPSYDNCMEKPFEPGKNLIRINHLSAKEQSIATR